LPIFLRPCRKLQTSSQSLLSMFSTAALLELCMMVFFSGRASFHQTLLFESGSLGRRT